MAGWTHPPRAEKRHLLVQVAGRDAGYQPHGDWHRDNDALLESFPAATAIRVRLLVASTASESTPGTPAEIALH